MTSTSTDRKRVLGIPIDPGTTDETRARVLSHLLSGEGCLHLATVNPEYIMTARRHPEFREILERTPINSVDGAGLAVAVRALYPGVSCERFTGVSLTWFLASIAADVNARIFLLGARDGVADQAAEVMLAKYPRAPFVGSWAGGSPRAEHDAESIERIAASGCDVLLVAYGAPQQVHWIDRNLPELERLGIRFVCGVGGAFDYISGAVRYPPFLVRRFGFEWLYRLAHEPWRWRRQRVLPLFALLVLRDVVRQRFGRTVH